MKKLLCVVALLFVTPVFGLVWENDPSYTPEERQKAIETNERIRKNMARMKQQDENSQYEHGTELPIIRDKWDSGAIDVRPAIRRVEPSESVDSAH